MRVHSNGSRPRSSRYRSLAGCMRGPSQSPSPVTVSSPTAGRDFRGPHAVGDAALIAAGRRRRGTPRLGRDRRGQGGRHGPPAHDGWRLSGLGGHRRGGLPGRTGFPPTGWPGHMRISPRRSRHVPDGSARPDGEVSAGATNGNAAVLVGLEYAPMPRHGSPWEPLPRRPPTARRRSGRRGPPPPATGCWAHDVWRRRTVGGRRPRPEHHHDLAISQMGLPGHRRRRSRKESPESGGTLPRPTEPVCW